MIEFRAGAAYLAIDPVHGGRVAEFRVGDRHLIARRGADDGPLHWGSYPMVPWAGRVKHGRFSFAGREYALPIVLDGHAIHGTGYLQAWERDGTEALVCDLGPDWPFGGWAVQRFYLTERQLVSALEVHADQRSMPASIGWHPWFVKPDRVEFTAAAMYERDASGIPTGAMISPPPQPPWDDCFIEAVEPIALHWGDFRLTVSSNCDHWVVYDMPAHATCVEPQSARPDIFNGTPHVVEPGVPLVRTMTWRW